MNNVNIFESAKPQGGDFFAFSKVGDAVQGTYIDKRNGTDSFGNNQTIYVLIANDGQIWNCGFRNAAITGQIIADRLKDVNFGVIVGFRYDKDAPSKIKPGTMAKVINVYFDPNVVDVEWIEQRKKIEAGYAQPDGPVMPHEVAGGAGWGAFSAPANASPAAGNLPQNTPAKVENEALKAIRSLAKTKGLTTDATNEADADAKIETYTGLKLDDESQLTQIIIKLTGYVSR